MTQARHRVVRNTCVQDRCESIKLTEAIHMMDTAGQGRGLVSQTGFAAS